MKRDTSVEHSARQYNWGNAFKSFGTTTQPTTIDDEQVWPHTSNLVGICLHREIPGVRVSVGFLITLVALLFAWQPVAAQSPVIVPAPQQGAGGDKITVRGLNFDPGGYDGLVFWNGERVDTLSIPEGGDFSIEFQIPPTAEKADDHVLSICAAFAGSCFTEEFEQNAEAAIAVTGPAPIRICKEEVEPCTGHAKATVYNITTGNEHGVDEDGYVLDREQIAADDMIWAMALNAERPKYSVYNTTGDTVAVADKRFQTDPVELRLALAEDNSLLVFDLDVSAEWYVQGNAQYTDWLTTALTDASNFFYNFTDGQMILGEIRVFQDGDNIADVDIRLLANNVLRPNAEIGGIASMEVSDPLSAVPFQPGQVYMGSYWNRYAQPPGQPVIDGGQVVPPELLSDDWALALTHELGHYLLYLFDTYRDAKGESNSEIAATCLGSAMGNVYDLTNHAFIADAGVWESRCSKTEAFAKHRGNSEWETIAAWYPWLTPPNTTTVSQDEPPISFTNITFVPPSTSPGPAATSQLFNLNYQDGETASGEARALIYRNGRVLEQGKPGEGGVQLSLVGAQVDDRLCVYDVNDYSEGTDSPRHQFGCEGIVLNDATLEMTKDQTWAPLIVIRQAATDTLAISVTQEIDGPLMARFYPEHAIGFTEFQLTSPIAGSYTGQVVFPETVLPGYVQFWVDEAVALPQSQRETMADLGVGGGGLFGPIRAFGGVYVQSSDGSSVYESPVEKELDAGHSIAWQSMPGTPNLPIGGRIIGQAYHLIAYPESLVEDGTVRIEFSNPDDLFLHAAMNDGTEAVVHFFDGQDWKALPTTISKPAVAQDETRVASAPSQGVGVYAILSKGDVQQIWLPTIMSP